MNKTFIRIGGFLAGCYLGVAILGKTGDIHDSVVAVLCCAAFWWLGKNSAGKE